MAMRPRGGGRTGGQPFRPPTRQTYDNFRPRSEWKYESDHILLLVHLPGFAREQLSILFTYMDDTSLGIRIQGRRPQTTGRWTQFSEFHRIPETVDASKISNQFENGVLKVVMPKLTVTRQTDQVAEPQKSRETPPSGDQKGTPQSSGFAAMDQKRAREEEEKLVEDQKRRKEEEKKIVEDQKRAREGEKKLLEDQRKEEKKQDEALTTHQIKDTPEDEGTSEDESTPLEGDSSAEVIQKPAAESAEKPETDEQKKPEPELAAPPAIAPETKEKKEQDHEEGSTAEEKSKAMDGDANHRQLFINMGTAALLIFGLGAYISYYVLSSGKNN